MKHKHHDVAWSAEDEIVSQGHPQSGASQLSLCLETKIFMKKATHY
jgi:hypothetical protein